MLTDILELHFIEFPKFRELEFCIDDPLHRWLRFLEQKITPEQLEELMSVDELIKEAEARLTYLESDEKTRLRYARREKFLHDQASLLHDARTAGLKEGLEKGIEQGTEQGIGQGIRAVAENMLKEGIELSAISKVIGLSLEELVVMKDTSTDTLPEHKK